MLAMYFDTTVVLSMRAREFPNLSGFLIVISGCLFFSPLHHALPGALFLKGVTHFFAEDRGSSKQLSTCFVKVMVTKFTAVRLNWVNVFTNVTGARVFVYYNTWFNVYSIM